MDTRAQKIVASTRKNLIRLVAESNSPLIFSLIRKMDDVTKDAKS